ncbi:uncharacterized protein LOC116950238 [Petromyzon marinus]|uniref:Uncharacterized protein LOC116950238 n=1 Tax=Petromyzon marinus TaxID=7757 RepID=A0AAJ7X7D3_PETMA|nr:uncharacterized protein LOC116950238 [Petromyzon marinus]
MAAGSVYPDPAGLDPAVVDPVWLWRCKRRVQDTKEWTAFAEQLSRGVQLQLSEGRVASLGDLSEAEKSLLVERAMSSLQGGDVYKSVVAKVASSLDEQLVQQVAVEVADDRVRPRSRVQVVQELLKSGLVSILHKWPELRSKLGVLFNHPLPSGIREPVWHLYLANARERTDFLARFTGDPASVQSTQDAEIFLRCESLLFSEPTFRQLASSKATARTMRSVLSYYHTRKRPPGVLLDSEYLLVVPLVRVRLGRGARVEPQMSVMAHLMEEFLTFMESRPAYMTSSWTKGTEHGEAEPMLQQIASTLVNIDKDLAVAVQKAFGQAGEIPKEAVMIGLVALLQPVVRVLFVGFLQLEVLLYVWDQYILGLEQPAYDCLPAFCLCLLLLLRDQLLTCDNPSRMMDTLRTNGPSLTVHDFQVTIVKHFYDQLSRDLNKWNVDELLELDPAYSMDVPSLWMRLAAVEPLTEQADATHKARHPLGAERVEWQAERLPGDWRRGDLRDRNRRSGLRHEDGRVQRLMEDSQRMEWEQRQSLEEQLAQERYARYKMLREAEEQMGRLRGEMERLQRRQPLSGYYPDRSLPPSLPPWGSAGPDHFPRVANGWSGSDRTALPRLPQNSHGTATQWHTATDRRLDTPAEGDPESQPGAATRTRHGHDKRGNRTGTA